MVTLIVVRHGFSAFNKSRIFSGQLDVPLDEKGVEQAEKLKNYLINNFKIDAVYSSDLSRAIDTVKPTAEVLGLNIKLKPGLRELYAGLWQGKTFDEVEREFPETFAVYKANVGEFRPDGGENYAEMTDRAVKAFREIVEENGGKTVLIATHGGLFRSFQAWLTGVPLEEIKKVTHVANASISIVTCVDGCFETKVLGYTEHLKNQSHFLYYIMFIFCGKKSLPQNFFNFFKIF